MVNSLPSYVVHAVVKAKQTTDEFMSFGHQKSSAHPDTSDEYEYKKMLDEEIEKLNQPAFATKQMGCLRR